ncbi:hypothetical protein CC117_06770 [Parafrankia colletiae]|uniref:UPF0182 protein CC117_06770 n=1 Tax=Parafrankia colletiae TaxID=573497 RepID=A0A1S1QC08_9ACTN|nr:UPF0182 family protein [Parafrankia colletiae]MCK9899731.1 UPF0182 family protein [Frankia sp. Cpl3]OHV30622.1 hypothetical protein CC117_06770 [Parafrankia colletiae]
MAGTSRRPLLTRTRLLVPVVGVLVLILVGVGVYTRLYTDLLFYRSVDFSNVFRTVVFTRILLFVLFGAVMAIAVGTNIVLAYRLRPPIRPLSTEQQNLERYRVAIEPFMLPVLLAVSALFGLVAGLSASGRWRTWLLWINSESFGEVDAQFGRDLSYYTFSYPFQRFLLAFLLTAVLLSLLVAVLTHYLFGGIRLQSAGERVAPAAKAHVSVLLGLVALLKAWAYYLDRFGLVFSSRGVSTGASYTDVHAVLPAKLILLFISLACAVLFIYNIFQRGWTLPLLGAGILVLSSVVIGGIYPAIVQQFQVKPNEASREEAYITRNIAATRSAYGIQDVEPVPYPVGTIPAAAEIAADKGTVPNIRLLDPSKMSGTFQQLQQIRGYYGFPQTLDVDRYTTTANGKDTTRDYVVSVRELNQAGLGEDQRNWINEHLTYTHGRGFVAAPSNTADEGRPAFTERNLPETGDLDVTESRVYFGEMSPEYSIVGTHQAEIDGPGPNDTQLTTSYDGDGGVSIGSSFRRGLFALRFGEANILLSKDITGDSRILYERNPRDRVSKVAPWLTLDGDPYPAVVDGRVTWILDGYTTSDGYPYSARRTFGDVTADAVTTQSRNRTQQPPNQVNYIRNSVKATVDAYNGTVTLYAWDEQDPVLRTWMKAFPDTVKPKKDIKPSLMEHLRYPEDLFKVQRDLIGQYHVDSARDFYSQEDFWNVSQSPDDTGEPQPPFYVYSQLPGRDAPSYNLTSPLISARSSKLAAYMAVSMDPDNYGRFTLLQLPPGDTINGPVQVQGAIESNGEVARQLNLWRGAGSQTIEGNLLTLPVAGGLLYVEPYYVQARGSTGYPTLQGVAAAFGDKIGFGSSLADALDDVFGPGAGASAAGVGTSAAPPAGDEGEEDGESGSGPPAPSSPPSGDLAGAIADADAAYRAGEEALAKTPPDFGAYGTAQKDLQDALGRLRALAPTAAPPTTAPPASPGAAQPTAAPAPTVSAAPASPGAPRDPAEPVRGTGGVVEQAVGAVPAAIRPVAAPTGSPG